MSICFFSLKLKPLIIPLIEIKNPIKVNISKFATIKVGLPFIRFPNAT